MSNQITTNYAKAYEGMFQRLAQQKVSYLKDKVKVKMITNADEWFMNQIGAVSMTTVTGQRQAISLGNTPHARRAITKGDSYFADTVEERDVVNMISDPFADYTVNALSAADRQFDQIIIDAAFADARTGVDGGTTTTFASEGTTIASGSVGLTFSKLLQIRKNYQNNNVSFSKINLVIGPEQEEDLYNMPEFTNKDFRDASQLDNPSSIDGYVGRFMEFDIWRSTLLTLNSSTRDCVSWVEGGIGLGIGIQPKVIIENRPDLVGSPLQVQVLMSAGASRLEGARVQKVQCDE